MIVGENDKLLIHYAEGRGNNLGKAKNKVGGWADFCKALSTPTKTKEKRRLFDKMSKDEQDELKAIDGWIIGAQVSAGRRTKENIQPRDLLTLDYDYATPAFVDKIDLGVTPLSAFEFFVHSTRRHTSDKPRLRLFAPLARPVTREEYVALSRIVAMHMEGGSPMKLVDKVSFRQAQMMFKPTISADGDWFCVRNEGDLIDPDAILAEFPNWSDYSTLPLCADEEEGGLRKSAEKAEDPTAKKGAVGDFCRAYDVPAAIDKFLSDCYAPVADYSSKPRYSYLKGTSTSGAVVEDNGLFLYSHHGSDPTADRLTNAFDLCRIHLYGELDEDEDKDTPPSKLPSYKAFVEFIADDPEYRRSQAESRYDISAMFDDVAEEPEDSDPDPLSDHEDLIGLNGYAHDLEDLIGLPSSVRGAGSPVDPPIRPNGRKRRKAPATDSWFPDALDLDENGRIKSTLPNAAIIIHNDPRMHDAIAFNDFSKQIVARYSIASKLEIAPAFICQDAVNGDRWQDYNDISIRAILEYPNGPGKRGYGMPMTDRNMTAAIDLAARRNLFHPVREFLTAPTWDGVTRIDTIMIRYLGCPDTPYHREIIRLKMIASVARVMEPGCKFDYAIILQGQQGIRKSSFIKALYGADWFGELDCRLDDKQQIAETIAGKWCLELPELSGFHKSDHNAAKMFMRRQTDDVRMAYAKRVSEFPRQCIFWGTTNDVKYLKDPTGNRSYWPVSVVVEEIDTDAVERERDQLWAEAVVAYRAMREAKGRGELPLTLSKAAIVEAQRKQDAARTEELHEMWAERIQEWADTPLTLRELLMEMGAPADERFSDGTSTTDFLVLRIAFTREIAVTTALKKDRGISDYQTAQNVERALPLLDGWGQPHDAAKGQTGGQRYRVMGKQARWWVRLDATREELKKGYRLVHSPSGGNDSNRDEDLI